MLKNGNGWTSEYRRKKFEERFRNKPVYLGMEFLDRTPMKLPSNIVVMLDVEGTCDNIDDDKANIFIRSLDVLRKQLGADEGIICISTHAGDTREMRRILAILERNLSQNIKIGTSFFYGGIYDRDGDLEQMIKPDFNRDKIGTFMSYYVNSYRRRNLWCGIFDDNIPYDIYRRHVHLDRPVLIGRPSSSKRALTKNNLLDIASTLKGFDGVLEIMNEYLKNIHHMNTEDIVLAQKNIIMHLSSYDLVDKIVNREYDFLVSYFKEGYADENDYDDAFGWLVMLNRDKKVGKEELSKLNEIFKLLQEHFHEIGQDGQGERVVEFQKSLQM